jgi:hypothetical protein
MLRELLYLYIYIKKRGVELSWRLGTIDRKPVLVHQFATRLDDDSGAGKNVPNWESANRIHFYFGLGNKNEDSGDCSQNISKEHRTEKNTHRLVSKRIQNENNHSNTA